MCAILGFTSPSLKKEQVLPYFEKTKSRGPDDTRLEPAGSGMLGFHRLAIMGLHPEGMQPFHRGGDMAVCNGELYGFRPVKKALEAKGYVFASDSDCEIILPLWQEYGTDMFAGLDAEFAMIIYDSASDSLVAARDPIGLRPLFYGYLADGSIIFASEAKNLVGLCAHVFPFPPGHYYKDGKFVRYADLTTVTRYSDDDLDTVTKKIREKLISAVEKRLDADAPLGFLLSGGLDSSLVCAISAKLLGKKIRTFAIGMDLDPIDLKYAKETADFIGAEHTEVTMTRQQVLDAMAAGMEQAARARADGVTALGIGEMGIGNTTTSAAVLAALTGADIEAVTGRGGGLTDEGFLRKKEVLRQALALHRPDGSDVIGVLAGVGGLDLAAMTGAFLGCAHERVPAAVDGFISIAAALCAVRLCPAVRDVLFLSHDSYEVGYRIAAETLGLQPCLRLGMRLGEGSGCPLLFRVLEGACGVMRGMATFGEASIEDSYLDEIRAMDAFTVEGA